MSKFKVGDVLIDRDWDNLLVVEIICTNSVYCTDAYDSVREYTLGRLSVPTDKEIAKELSKIMVRDKIKELENELRELTNRR